MDDVHAQKSLLTGDTQRGAGERAEHRAQNTDTSPGLTAAPFTPQLPKAGEQQLLSALELQEEPRAPFPTCPTPGCPSLPFPSGWTEAATPN